jgi:hypothetical protein
LYIYNINTDFDAFFYVLQFKFELLVNKSYFYIRVA